MKGKLNYCRAAFENTGDSLMFFDAFIYKQANCFFLDLEWRTEYCDDSPTTRCRTLEFNDKLKAREVMRNELSIFVGDKQNCFKRI